MKTPTAWCSCNENMNQSFRINPYVCYRWLARGTREPDASAELRTSDGRTPCSAGWALAGWKVTLYNKRRGPGEQTEHNLVWYPSRKIGHGTALARA